MHEDKVSLLKLLQIFAEEDYLQMKAQMKYHSKEELRLAWIVRLFPSEFNCQVKEDSSSVSKLFENSNYTPTPPPKRTYGRKWILVPLMQAVYANPFFPESGNTFLNLMLEHIKDVFHVSDSRLPEMISSLRILLEHSNLWDERLPVFIQELHREETVDCICYALFLLILCAFYNWDVKSFDYLYSPYILIRIQNSTHDDRENNNRGFDFLQKTKVELKQEMYDFYASKEMLEYVGGRSGSSFSSLRSEAASATTPADPDCFFFEGSAYVHEYYFYAYHPTRWETICTQSRLRFEIQHNKSYIIHLQLVEGSVTRCCTGTAIQNKNTQLVYAILHDTKLGETMILSFEGQHFNKDMYYRPAFLLRHYPGSHIPMIEKACISLYPVHDSVVRGLLNMQDTFFVPDNRLREFIRTYENQPWMKDFTSQSKIRDFLNSGTTQETLGQRPDGLLITESFILGIELSCTSDRLQQTIYKLLMLQLLKGFSIYRNDTVSLKEPDNLNVLIRELPEEL
ncbi:MAG: hypothetical protein PUG60_12605 [Lachnospiraceae bacterium]|nr:hypothetical protein [Lachnospiraceae bacterium]MDY4969260.1 hypothetical protein [Lachnospiraceae bacterium]